YIVGAGPGGQPLVKVYDGATGALLRNFLAFEPGFGGGVFVAAGGVNGDGVAGGGVGLGAGRGGPGGGVGGVDRAGRGGVFVCARAFTGGVRVAAGDVNGDGFADLVVGTGPGIGTQVQVLSGADLSLLRIFAPYNPAFTGGVWVAAGDVTGDGFADIVTGADAGGAPHVRLIDGATGVGVLDFFAYDVAFGG